MKLLSVIVPAYNSAGFLDICIPSLLHPAVLEDLEVIIVNDGSADATAAVAQGYCRRYPGTVRLLCQENRGHGGALNTGCAAATGKYLKVIDADDWVQTRNLPAFLQALGDCDSDVVLTHYRTVDIRTGQQKSWRCFPEAFGKGHTLAQILDAWGAFDRCMTFHGITYRTDFYRERGIALSEHVFYEDYEFATFPCCHAASITPLDLFVYEYRIGDVAQSVSQESRVRRMGHTEAVLQRMMAEYRTLSGEAPRAYAAVKIQELLLSYLTTALLVHPDRALGRRLAKGQMALCKARVPQAWKLARWKYIVFQLFSLLHISKADWDRLLSSRFYRRFRGQRDFD